MSGTVNKTILLGNVGRDPDIRESRNGDPIATFSLATQRGFKKDAETDWHRCTAFGKTAEVVRDYVRKGSKLYLEGRLEYSTYEKDGQTHYGTSIIVNHLVMLGGGRDER